MKIIIFIISCFITINCSAKSESVLKLQKEILSDIHEIKSESSDMESSEKLYEYFSIVGENLDTSYEFSFKSLYKIYKSAIKYSSDLSKIEKKKYIKFLKYYYEEHKLLYKYDMEYEY